MVKNKKLSKAEIEKIRLKHNEIAVIKEAKRKRKKKK